MHGYCKKLYAQMWMTSREIDIITKLEMCPKYTDAPASSLSKQLVYF